MFQKNLTESNMNCNIEFKDYIKKSKHDYKEQKL